MVETKRKKGSISEEVVSILVNKYPAKKILDLLKEVAQFGGVKIDWDALVKKTATGISSAREYQMLWRHLAYHDPLLEKLEDDAEPLDDDSDLEFDLEAFPAVSGEVSAEAAACVKVLISSGLPSETGPTGRPTVEAPLTINIPNGQASFVPLNNQQLPCSTLGTNITVPVSVQKQSLPSVPSAEGLNGNGSAGASAPAKKKRKLWTQEEDMELIAAVQKCGEGNWANILKGDFKHNRTASQLSQRWSLIRKRRANSNAGNAINPSGSALTEAQLAAREAVSIALGTPTRFPKLSGSIGVTSQRKETETSALRSTAPPSSSAIADAPSEVPPVSAVEALSRSQVQQASNHGTLQKGTLNPSNKSRTNQKIPAVHVKPPGGPASLIKAAAFAAGGRIATPSTAASLFKATQSKNAIHIRPVGALTSSPVLGSKPLPTANILGPHLSNIHCSRTTTPPVCPGTAPGDPRPDCHQMRGSSASPLPPSIASSSNATVLIEEALPESQPALHLCADPHGNVKGESANAISTATSSNLRISTQGTSAECQPAVPVCAGHRENACADPRGNAEGKSADVTSASDFDSCKEENKGDVTTVEETKIVCSALQERVALPFDVDENKIVTFDHAVSSRAVVDKQMSAPDLKESESLTASNKAEAPCMDPTEGQGVADDAGGDQTVGRATESLNEEVGGNQLVVNTSGRENVADEQVCIPDYIIDVAKENKIRAAGECST